MGRSTAKGTGRPRRGGGRPEVPVTVRAPALAGELYAQAEERPARRMVASINQCRDRLLIRALIVCLPSRCKCESLRPIDVRRSEGGAVIDASDTAISADQRPNMLTRRPGGAAVTHLHTQCSHYSDLYKPTGDRSLFDCELTA